MRWVPSKVTEEAGVASGWSAGPFRNSAFRVDWLPEMRIVIGTCCVSRTVAKPCQIPSIGDEEGDWAGTAEGARALGRTLTDNTRRLVKSFMVELQSILGGRRCAVCVRIAYRPMRPDG